jgi:hypothetical protein
MGLNKKRTCAAVGLIVACLVAFYAVIKPPPEVQRKPEEAVGEIRIENIDDLIAKAVAEERGVLENDVRICFYEQTQASDIYAVGAVIRGENAHTLIFLFDNLLRSIIQIENWFTPTTNEEFWVLANLAEEISLWTGNEIVPCGLTRTDGSYEFKYYDGYIVPGSRWSYGFATFNLENETVEWGIHVM